MSVSTMPNNEETKEHLARARQLWLSPHADMKEVERLYRQILNGDSNNNNNLDDDETIREASEKLSLLLCQSGRSQEAAKMLSSLGYTCRLSSKVLDYLASTTDTTNMDTTDNPPCRILDGFLSDDELNTLKSVFMNPEANYWTDHDYKVEPPSPYFSYLIPLAESNQFGFIGKLVQKCFAQLRSEFPSLSKTTCVEMWAHNRPHAAGHQMHFDSDNEGMGGVRNPIISTILYITSDTGGPSLVTNQKLIHRHLATKGWMSHAKEKRLVAFDGKVLHGVVPGKGSSTTEGRRVTLMFAFWKKIKVRTEGSAACTFPTDNNSEWSTSLRRQDSPPSSDVEPTPVAPLEIKPIYETLEGGAWTREMGFPDYDNVYQGF